MPSFTSHPGARDERHVRPAASLLRWPVLAAVLFLVVAALTLVACSPSATAKQVEAAPAAPAKAAAPVAQATVAKPSTGLGSQYPLVTGANGVASVPAVELADGQARYYAIRSGQKLVPFFVVQGSDGVVRAALDACDVCFASKKGYHQEGDVMVCNNCGTRFPLTLINVEKGGCNPSPLQAVVKDGQVIIQLAELTAGARYF
jgi:uncharacterized membrane protein